MKCIAITGPESTGKSELTEKLAKHYHTTFVPEYARAYLDKLNRQYGYEDILEIAKEMIKEGQLATANQLLTTDYLFFDTELINIKIWLEFYHWEVPKWLTDHIDNFKFDLYLLMDIDLPWVADSQRSNPNDRVFLFQRFEEELKKIGANYFIISGKENNRLVNATAVIDNFKL